MLSIILVEMIADHISFSDFTDTDDELIKEASRVVFQLFDTNKIWK